MPAYQMPIASAADHMTILAPFQPPLTQLLDCFASQSEGAA